jgi:hypothetical protein
MSDELDRKLQQLVHEQTETARTPLGWTAVSERSHQIPAASRGRRWPAAAAAAVLIVAGVAVIALARSDGSETSSPVSLPAGPVGSDPAFSNEDQGIGSDDDSANTTSPSSSAADEQGDPRVTTRTASIVGVEVSESDSSIAVTFLRAPVPCEQFHEVALLEDSTRVEITVTVEVREQEDGERCPDILIEETTTVELQAPLGERQLVYDGTSTTPAVSSEMSVDGPIIVGAEFEVSFEGSLRRIRGGYFWLQELDGTRVALLRSDGNSEIPMSYNLDVANAGMLLADGLSGESSMLVLPPQIEPGPYLLCTANSVDEVCIELDVQAA